MLVKKAFEELNLPDTELICKTVPVKAPITRADLIQRPLHDHQKWKRELFICDYLSWGAMVSLIQSADVSVNPSSGEGWGLIPLEDAACGCCTILTDYSGYAEYASSSFMLPLRYNTSGTTYFMHQMGEDATPDYEHLKELMLWTYENRREARHLGYLSSRSVKRYDWEQVACEYIRKLKEFV